MQMVYNEIVGNQFSQFSQSVGGTDMETLAGQLEQQYPLLTTLRIAETSAEDHESLPHFLGLLLAASESEDRRSVCFIFPDASEITSTVAMLSSLSWLSNEFEDLAREYALDSLKPGQRVRIWPTKHVYEYAGVFEADERYLERIYLKVQGKQDFRALHISDVLRLEQTTGKAPKGKVNTPLPDIMKPNALDTLLGIRSHGNTSMLKNRVLYLTSKSRFEKFLSSTECSRHNGTASAPVTLAEALPWGTVNEDGSLSSSDDYQVEGEPLLAISHSGESIAEASLKAGKFSRVVLCDDPRNLTRNLQACDEVMESQKLIVVASHSDDEALAILKNRGFVTWHISPKEINLSHDTSIRIESSFFGKPLTAAKNYRKLKLEDIFCRDESVEFIAENLQRAGNDLKHPDSDEEAKRCLKELFNILFSISDRCVPLATDGTIEIHERLNKIKVSVAKRSIYISAEVAEYISEACTALSRLVSINTCGTRVGEKKGEAILELLQNSNGHHRNLIMTRYPKNVAPLQKWLKQRGIDTPVVWYRSLPEDETFDGIILTSWLNSERFGRLVKRYAAPRVHLLGYPFEKKWLRQYKTRLLKERFDHQIDNGERSAISGLPEEIFPSSDKPVQEPRIVEDDPEMPSIFEIERKILRQRKGARPSTYSGPDDCESRYVGFVGEFYAHLTESREVSVVTSLILVGKSSPAAVPERTVNELEVGDFVLFREGSDKDVVQLFAEESIGQEEYGRLRKLANVWREALRAHGGSVRELHRFLKSYGLKKKEFTIRGWLQNRSLIGPFAEQDVQIIARATKGTFSWTPGEVWEAISTIRNAHRSAGRQISAWLLEELSGKGSLIADSGGKIDLGFGELQIVEVEEIGAELEEYPAGKVNRLLKEC